MFFHLLPAFFQTVGDVTAAVNLPPHRDSQARTRRCDALTKDGKSGWMALDVIDWKK